MTSSRELPDQEPSSASRTVTVEPTKPANGQRRALSALRRELDDKEFSSPAVQRLLVDEIERLEAEVRELVSFRERYFQSERRAAVLEQKGKDNNAFEILSLTCITVGGAAIGYAPNVWTVGASGWVALGLGGLLVVGGVVAKAVKS
ncbi:hypothetical protein [Roseateles sp.]|uniref:hypothetical protein n=1 Tax=Roseateles sp. TaxID=1971397 RepID=UPI003BA4094C